MSVNKSELDSLRIERPAEAERTSRRPLIAVLAAVAIVAIALIVFAIARPNARVVTVAPAPV